MIVIFISWLILLGCFMITGSATDAFLKIHTTNPVFKIMIGMMAQTVLLTICAFFVPIGLGLFAGNMLLTIFLALIFRKKITNEFLALSTSFRTFSIYAKAIFGIILLSALFKCAQSPFILDNESYYVQTIKWLNEYGFVKGLANLNVAFGQTSAWHVLQAGFNFSFLTERINDLNGFLIVICSFFFIDEWNKKSASGNINWLGLIVTFNVLLFQFINAPSPDFPLIIISQLLFYIFLKRGKTASDLKMMALLTLFLIFIKITIAPIAVLVLYELYKQKKGFQFFMITGFLFGFLWLLKNIILFGYPLFPLPFLRIDADWTIPNALLQNLNNMIKNHEFMTIKGYKSFSIVDKFLIWIRFGGINSIFNKGILMLFLLVLFTKQMQTSMQFRILYFALLLHFIIVFLVSPQFRFFLPEFIFLSVILIADIFNRIKIAPKFVNLFLVSSVILPLVISLLIDFKTLTSNKLNQKEAAIKPSQLYLPELNSRYGNIDFETFTEGNLKFYSPKQNFFFYGTANGPLPSTNIKIIQRFKKRYHIIPQLRTGELKDGFYSKKIE
ncbi:MAG: hypothetical protein PSV16_07515 [Flavobacterium sp.]|nr:hypothetical protein [Flavobacterium sp.]